MDQAMQVTVGSTITVEHPSSELVQWCKDNLIIISEYELKAKLQKAYEDGGSASIVFLNEFASAPQKGYLHATVYQPVIVLHKPLTDCMAEEFQHALQEVEIYFHPCQKNQIGQKRVRQFPNNIQDRHE